MAGDWIKMRVWIARDPQVIAIADYLAVQRAFMDWLTDPVHRRCDESVYEHVTRDVTVSVTVASLLQVWGIACDRGKADGDDLVLSHTTLDRLDTIAGTPCFGVAMASVGWALEEDQDGERARVRFPKALLYLVPTENRKQEAHAERQRRYRERQKAKRDAESDASSGATVAPQSDARGEERREEKKESSTALRSVEDGPPLCQAAAGGPPSDFTFPTRGKGGGSWTLPAAKLAEYREAYPDLDVEAELRNARQWCRDNASDRKTSGGMLRFLTNWLNRSQNNPKLRARASPCDGRQQHSFVDPSKFNLRGDRDD